MKTKALISCAETAQLICAFGFAYADAVAHLSVLVWLDSFVYSLFCYAETAQLICAFGFAYADAVAHLSVLVWLDSFVYSLFCYALQSLCLLSFVYTHILKNEHLDYIISDAIYGNVFKIYSKSLRAVTLQKYLWDFTAARDLSEILKIEPSHGKTNNLHRRKQRRRSASR